MPKIKSIKFGKFRLTNDNQRNWVVYRKGNFKKPHKKKYYPNLESALFGILQLMVMDSSKGKKSVESLRKVIIDSKETICKAVKGSNFNI